MTRYGTEYGSLYAVEEFSTPIRARRTYPDIIREQTRLFVDETEEETQSTVQAAEQLETEQDSFDWSIGYSSESDNSGPIESVPPTPPTPVVPDIPVDTIPPPGYIPRDFGSPSDTAWLLLRQNPEICEQNGVCPREIENLVRNALVMQSMNPTLSKTDIIGCLCPDGKCKPLPPIGASSIKVVVDCLECEDDCPICLCPMENEMGCITSCRHIFHRSCFFKIPEDPWGNWKRCPLCRTRLSARSYDIIRDRFDTWSNCNCCEHHKRRRPSKFCAGAPNVEHFGKCSDPRARVVFELLFRLRECTPTCHCSCRSEMRRLCRLNIYKY
jgi:hypothetical protein